MDTEVNCKVLLLFVFFFWQILSFSCSSVPYSSEYPNSEAQSNLNDSGIDSPSYYPDVTSQEKTNLLCQWKAFCNGNNDCQNGHICNKGLCTTFPTKKDCSTTVSDCKCETYKVYWQCPKSSLCVDSTCLRVKCKEDCDCAIGNISSVICGTSGYCEICDGTCTTDRDCGNNLRCYKYGLLGTCTYCGKP